MNRRIFLLSGLAISTLLGGCIGDQESRDFFYSGWVNPERGANRRMYGTDLPPEEMRNGRRPEDSFSNRDPLQTP